MERTKNLWHHILLNFQLLLLKFYFWKGDWALGSGLRTLNPLNVNFTKWSTTLKHFVGNLAMNCLSVLDHFVGLVLKGLSRSTTREATRVQSLLYQKSSLALLVVNETYTKMLHYFTILFPRYQSLVTNCQLLVTRHQLLVTSNQLLVNGHFLLANSRNL